MAKDKAWVMIPHSRDKGMTVEIEIKPLVLCEDCCHYDGEGTCMKIGLVTKDGKWFCANGEEADND